MKGERVAKQIDVVASYNESGGVNKTTTSVSMSMVCASVLNLRTVVVDLDPRGAATDWFNVKPKDEGLHIGAILANDDVEGWAQELAVPSGWHENLRVIPSHRSVSNREKDTAQGLELRLKESLAGIDADVVIIDCPNRQGGPLTLSALYAANKIVYATAATQDGVNGVEGARKSVAEFRRLRERQGASANLTDVGIVVGNVSETIMTRLAVSSIEQLRDTGLMLEPLIPSRVIVGESRAIGEWYGRYRKGEPVVNAYTEITRKVLAA